MNFMTFDNKFEKLLFNESYNGLNINWIDCRTKNYIQINCLEMFEIWFNFNWIQIWLNTYFYLYGLVLGLDHIIKDLALYQWVTVGVLYYTNASPGSEFPKTLDLKVKNWFHLKFSFKSIEGMIKGWLFIKRQDSFKSIK